MASAPDSAGLWTLRTTLALLRGLLPADGGDADALVSAHPVLQDALEAAARLGLDSLTLAEALARLDLRLDLATPAPAPLDRLRRRLALSHDGLGCLVLAALPDADPRLGPLIDDLHGQQGRPTRATLQRLFGSVAPAAVQALRAAGCLVDQHRALALPADLWDMACGLPPLGDAWRHTAVEALPALDDLILPPSLRQAVADGLAAPGEAAWLLRGTAGSGRRTLAAAIARAQGLGLLEVRNAAALPPASAAAVLLHAMPLASFDPAPGECLAWTLPAGAPGTVAARLPRHGGLAVEGRSCRRIDLDAPGEDERRQHWHRALGCEPPAALAGLRLPRGTLHRAAAQAEGRRDAVQAVLDEVEALGRHALDGLARRVPPAVPGEPLALPWAAREEFDVLVARCRHRDRIAAALPATPPGLRALFKGPSGTGKTLAARQLAAALQRPLYRVDLAATVSKYIGETERNLERVFAAAESLDIVLLLDEGDALLAGRTAVSTATDRYANLEINYLLQRLEQYSGVLVVTTNAPERIDTAFARRMDVSVEFPLPDADTRLDLWLAHLGGLHAVADGVLDQVALRCLLSGGQIRNAVLHATLLAIDGGRPVGARELRQALQREYRKAGQQCPSLDDGP